MPSSVGLANLIKAQIRANIDALVTSGDLGGVVEEDVNTNVLDLEFPGYPCAVIGTSGMDSVWEYQQANKRTYTFDILVVQLQDNLTSLSDMEDLRDTVATRFDNNVTLAGAAPLGVAAIVSPAATMASKGKNFVIFNVTIRATAIQDLTYNF